MKKTFFCSFLFVFLFFSCKKNIELTYPKPKMVSILADVHVAESAALNLLDSKKDSMLNVYMHQIYEIHSTNENEFRQNLELIKKEPMMMRDFYKLVQDTLTERSKAISG